MLLGSPPDMIRGYPLRKTGSAASHGGLSMDIFYYKSELLATEKNADMGADHKKFTVETLLFSENGIR